MRVTGGELGGRTLRVPARGVRPTADRVRESMFMMLSPELAGARVLDLYAGTGALGIEALSRGAKSCLFVESDRQAVAILGENLARLGLGGRAEIAGTTVERWLESADRRLMFELVLMDPPYQAPGILAVLAAIERSGRVVPGGRLVIEHDRRVELEAAGFELLDRRRYGDTVVSFLTPVAPPAAAAPLPGPRSAC
jgi:16S rRNA (guanine(966)-N(2))-methyltransferase RsmD